MSSNLGMDVHMSQPYAWGQCVSYVGFGIVLMQAISFFQHDFKTSQTYVRRGVPLLLALNVWELIARLGFILTSTTRPALSAGFWTATLVLAGLTYAYTQAFACYRSISFATAIHGRLSKTRAIIMAIISLLILVSVGCGVWAVALLTVGPNLEYDNRLNSTVIATITTWICSGAVIDLLLISLITFDFSRIRRERVAKISTAPSKSHEILKRLTYLSLNNGGFVFIFQLLGFLLFHFVDIAWITFVISGVGRMGSVGLLCFINSAKSQSRLIDVDNERRMGQDLILCPPWRASQLQPVSPFPLRPTPSPGRPPPHICTCRATSTPNRSGFSPSTASPSTPRSSASFSSFSQRRLGRRRPPTLKRHVVMLDQEDDERQRGVLVSMSGSVTVEIDEGEDDEEGDPARREDWEMRRERLGLGNTITIETATSYPSPRANLHPLPLPSPSITRTFRPNPLHNTKQYPLDVPQSTTPTSIFFSVFHRQPSFPPPRPRPSSQTNSRTPLPFIDQWPSGSETYEQPSIGSYDPDSIPEYSLPMLRNATQESMAGTAVSEASKTGGNEEEEKE